MSYLSEVLTDNPIHYWRLADQGGRLAHDIGSATPLILGATMAETFPYTGIASDGGAAAAAASRLRSAGSGVHLPATGWAMEVWAFLSNDLNSAANQVIFDLTDDAHGVTLRCWAQTDGKWGSAGTFFANQLSATLTWNAWHHVVYEFTGAARNTYVDGASIASVASGAFGAADYRVDLGSNGSGGEFCYGGIAEAAVYDHDLGLTRVAAHYGAADTTTASPIYVAGGSVGVGIGGTAPYESLLSAIWNAVHKVY